MVASSYGGRNRLVAEAFTRAYREGTPRSFEDLEAELLKVRWGWEDSCLWSCRVAVGWGTVAKSAICSWGPHCRVRSCREP